MWRREACAVHCEEAERGEEPMSGETSARITAFLTDLREALEGKEKQAAKNEAETQ